MLRDLLLEERLTPAVLWSELDPATRQLAAESLYAEADGRREADAAVANALRFRPAAVQRLPLRQRVGYLLRAVFPDDSLSGSLLLALHLEHRRPLLSAFLDHLDIPHEDGMIEPDAELEPFSPERLGEAATALFDAFPDSDVELYLASLLALDPDLWGGLRPLLEQRT